MFDGKDVYLYEAGNWRATFGWRQGCSYVNKLSFAESGATQRPPARSVCSSRLSTHSTYFISNNPSLSLGLYLLFHRSRWAVRIPFSYVSHSLLPADSSSLISPFP